MTSQGFSSLRRLGGAFARRLGLGVATAGIFLPGAASPQTAVYRPSDGAPAAWREFALLVQARVQDWLAGEDQAARGFRASLETRKEGGGATTTVVARLWIKADGKIERADFDGLEAPQAAELRTLLTQKNVEAAPPLDMLQPLHLKFALRENDAPARP